jgi:D-3-phosphoglycerate dehydrogenase
MNVRAVIPKCILKAKKSLSALYAGAGCSRRMKNLQRKQKRYTVPDVTGSSAWLESHSSALSVTIVLDLVHIGDTMKVLVLARIHPDGVLKLKEKCEVKEVTGLTEKDIVKEISEYDAVVVRSKPAITKPVIDAATHLKAIGRAGVGLDNVDVDYATSKGIAVVNTPEASTESVAEHVFALLLSKARDIPKADSALKQGKWIKKELMGTEIQGKTLGIIGFGRIGSRLGEIAQGFKMKVLAYDVIDISERAQEVGAKVVSKEELLEKSHFITLHVPLLPSTRHLISEKEIKKMKKGAVLINTARGGIVDEDALYTAVTEKKIQACLDVFEKEPPTNSNLLSIEGTVFTPHIAGSTEEAQRKAGTEVARKILDVLTGKIENRI